jgi:pimeloyl-ACP methyl ester carboxylesterase
MVGGIGTRLDELVVVVPGILGSRLTRVDRDGSRHELWGTTTTAIVKNLLTFGHRIQGLALRPDDDPEAPKDGIIPTGLISDFQLIPGFTGIAGYDGLIERLRRDNGLRDDQVIGFAYDWRLSNRVNGHKLAEFLDREVEKWRDTTGNRDSRAVLVCHSMGGLVARWCTEREHGYELVSRTITIGTPFKGAGMALDALVNGVRLPKHLGPRFDDLVRSLPSVRELLPTYACVRSDGKLKRLDEVDLLPSGWASEGLGFHRELAEAVSNRDPGRTDALDAFRGGLQPTLTTASLGADGKLSCYETWDGTAAGVNYGGDGTVPRDSATPPEWSNQALAKAVAQRHAKMQLAPSVQTELNIILTDAPQRLSAGAELGMRLPPTVPTGEPFDVIVDAPPGLGLTARVDPLDSTTAPMKKAAKTDASGGYRMRIGPLAPGLYDVTIVRSNSKSAPVDEVSDTLLVYSGTDAGD